MSQLKIVDSNINGGSSAVIGASGSIFTFENATGTPSEIAGTLLHVAQGTDYNNRIANTIELLRISAQIGYFLPTGSNGDQLRLILYEDKQPNGGAPVPTDILQYATLYSDYNWFYLDRFGILFDQTYDLNPPTSTVADQSSVPWYGHTDIELYLHKIRVRYSDVTGVLSEIQSGNLGILGITLNGQVSTLGGSLIRIQFVDLP